ncbi:MAG: hypothetical protein ACRD1R_12495 [Acidobacteriota bacterium]
MIVRNLTVELIGGWARSDLQAALAFLRAQPDPDLRIYGLDRVANLLTIPVSR